MCGQVNNERSFELTSSGANLKFFYGGCYDYYSYMPTFIFIFGVIPIK